MGLNNNKTKGLAGQGSSLSTFEDVLTSQQAYGDVAPLPLAVRPLVEPFFGQGRCTPASAAANLSNRAWMPSASIQYQLTFGAISYFFYSRGFKAGGLNTPGVLNTRKSLQLRWRIIFSDIATPFV